MRSSAMVLFLSATTLGIPAIGQADDDFYGIVEARPSGLAGAWTIGGRRVEVTDKAELDEDDGPASVGACVSVDFEGSVVEEIETERMSRCATR